MSTLEQVRRKLGLPRFGLGSFSEARNVFDPDLLEPLLAQLLTEASEAGADPRLSALDLTPTVVDSTMRRALPKMLWASWRTGDVHTVKVHLEYSLLKSAPSRATVTPARRPDRRVRREPLAGGKLYVLDRGYTGHALMASILAAGSSFVVRLQHHVESRAIETRAVGAAASRRACCWQPTATTSTSSS